ncbi:ubiquitin-associated protein 1-like isoform X2 [Dromaius novaehollandiae]|uniref:ubiquitin-associated protein 1-like isoform X2 n=1 Tax=Dromaius novaehollandiae TaxID=8790 RepID=UPI00311E8488
MSYLDEVPFRTARSFEGDAARESALLRAPAVDVPDCAELLVSTMHDFSLERKVLYWIEAASQQQTSRRGATSEVVPTAPPCWLLLVGPEDSYGGGAESEEAAGRGKDGGAGACPVRRCVSLGAAAEARGHAKGRGALSDTESEAWPSEEEEYSEDDEYSSTSWEENDKEEKARRKSVGRAAAPCAGLRQARPKTSPGWLEPTVESGCRKPASPDPAGQRRSMVILNNMKNELEGARRKLAALVHPFNRAYVEKKQAFTLSSLHPHPRGSRNFKHRSAAEAEAAWPGTLRPAPPCRAPRAPAAAASIPPIKKHKPTVASLSPYACLPPASAPARPLGSHRAHPDSAADLLSALSQEERDLIEPVVALGYPARKAILTLQKTGKQSLSQFLGYLRACDRLLKQGYEEGQVEEAMEMFQYSEKKAAEFLHLLAQFNDMGFQQNEIKEVLLLCENHREKALEELMTQRQ